MEIKLKQRIIGGCVLAALAIIFLPLFFKGNNSIQKQVTLDAPIPPAPPKPALQTTTMVFQGDELNVNQDNKQLNDNKTTSSTMTELQQANNAGSQPQTAAQKINPNDVAFGSHPMSATTNDSVTNKTPIKNVTKLAASAASNTALMPHDADSVSQQTIKTTVTASTIQSKNKHNNEVNNLNVDKKITSVTKAKVTVNSVTTKEAPAHHTSSLTSSKTTVVKQEKLTTAAAWVVQLGSFDKPEHAKVLTKKLRDKGFKAFTREMKTAKGTMTKVLVGPEIKREKANALQVAINKDMKLKGIVVAFKPLEAKG